MDRAKQVIDRVLEGVLITLMAAAVINVLWQVFARFVLDNPSSFTEEVARFLLIWIGILGSGYAAGRHEHLALELLPEHLDSPAREWLQVVIQGFIALFALVVLIGGGVNLVYVQLSYGQTSASLSLPLGYLYTVLPLSGLIMVFYAAAHINGYVRTIRGEASTGSPDQAYK